MNDDIVRVDRKPMTVEEFNRVETAIIKNHIRKKFGREATAQEVQDIIKTMRERPR